MKIYYVTEAIMNDWSAPSVHVDEICKNMAREGCVVTLYLPTTGVFDSVKEYARVHISAPHTFHSAFYQPLLFVRLWRDIARSRPDIIYSRHSGLLLVPVLIGKLFGIPVVLEVNEQLSTDATFDHSTISYVFKTLKIFRAIEWLNFKLASKLVAVTDGIRNNAIMAYGVSPDKAVTVTNGVDTDFFKPIPASENKITLGEGPMHVGYIGSFLAWQGLRYVVAAAKLLAAKGARITFTIVGGGVENEYLSNFIRDNHLESSVTLHAPIPHDLVPLYINAFDICISYPITIRGGITSPFKVYEYLSCGKPVLSSRIAGMREEFGDVIRYAEPESPESLAEELLKLLEDKNKLPEMGEASRAFIVKGHSWRAVTGRILDICKTLIPQK